MKKVLLFLLFSGFYTIIESQEIIIKQAFDNGTTLPSGWEYKLDTIYTSRTNCGENIPSIKFSATGQYVQTPVFKNAANLSFWIKGISTDSLSYLLIEILCDSIWANWDTLKPLPKIGTLIKKQLPDSVLKIRFSYYRSKGNLAFDDILISRPTLPPLLDENVTSLNIISDYSVMVRVKVIGSGNVAYMVLNAEAETPTMEQMLNFGLYNSSIQIVDSGHVAISNQTKNFTIYNLSPATDYALYLLPTGSNNNIDSISRIVRIPFKTLNKKPDLFFSAVVKGKQNNKIIALYNPTPDTIDMSCYRIAISTNGGGWTTSYFTFTNKNIILPYSQYIIMKNSADSLFKRSYSPDTTTGSKIIGFTGNDARAIQRTVNKGKSWFTIDQYGMPDRNTNFDVAGIFEAAGKYNLYRKKTIFKGNANWIQSAGTDSVNSEWLVRELTDYSEILKSFIKPSRKVMFNSIQLDTLTAYYTVDSLQNKIYLSFRYATDLRNIAWLCILENTVKFYPVTKDIYDLSHPVEFILVDTITNDSTRWTLISKGAETKSDIVYPNIEISVFPNPVHRFIQIFSPNQIIKLISIIDMNGNILKSVYYTNTLDMNEFLAGVYDLKIYLSNNQVINRRILKK
jgi:hypothetical protein